MQRKYVTLIIGFILSALLFLTIYILGELQISGGHLIPYEYISKFVAMFPGPLVTDILLLYTIPIGIFVLYYLIAPYFIVLYIKVHKFFYWLLRRPSKYGIFKLGKKVKSGRLFSRALIVSLFAFSISVLIVTMGYGALFRPNFIASSVLSQAEAAFLGTFAICSITIILFFPIWLLEDSGMVSYRVFHEERMPVDIQGVHSIYYQVLLGYAGLSTVLALIRYITETLKTVHIGDPAILTPLILIVLPLLTTGLLAIPIYLYERMYEKNLKRVQTILSKYNFPVIQIPHFDEMVKDEAD
ncbi:MAG: hypothetical protein ACTSRC_01755 [Candidatus Helarchaeota archaeon]